jgi:branched-subunit amino acid aminotransferase/4-amino-4-deoxychorismate lyase
MTHVWHLNPERFEAADTPSVSVSNRSYLYGDGCFESLRAIRGRLLFAQTHFDRLISALKALGIECPAHLTAEVLDKSANELLEKNGINEGGRLRLTVWRESAGNYRPESHSAGGLLTAVSLPDPHFVLHQKNLRLDIYPQMKKEVNFLANHKTSSCQLYVQASIYAAKHGLDDALIMNDKGGIIESTDSNLFVVSNRVLYTPGLDSGCVAGTMRMRVINLAIRHGLKVYECNISPQHLLAADELLLTNAVKGVQRATAYRTKHYSDMVGRFLTEKLNEEARAF